MNESIGSWTRRDFLRSSAAGASAAVSGASGFARETSGQEFAAAQEARRKELWTLLGELPWQHRPDPPKLVSTEEHNGYTLERLILDLNGKEPVPALLLIPDRRQTPAPGMLYIHWHAGMYGLGKEQLLQGVQAQPAYAPTTNEGCYWSLSWNVHQGKIMAPAGSQGYPADLETLVKGAVEAHGQTVHFLPKVPVDPVTGAAEWGVKHLGNSPQGPIFDVYTKSEGTALDGIKYKDWQVALRAGQFEGYRDFATARSRDSVKGTPRD
jgi:Abhydrolase family